VRRLPRLAAALLVLVLAACGGGGSKPYTAQGTAACLTKQGFTGVTTSPDKIGFIAAFAANGGILAKSPSGNTLTIAFADSDQGAASTQEAFRKHAPPSLRPHMADIMQSKHNAVLVWTVTPSSQDLAAAEGCLAA
jgi:hypothetical protein